MCTWANIMWTLYDCNPQSPHIQMKLIVKCCQTEACYSAAYVDCNGNPQHILYETIPPPTVSLFCMKPFFDFDFCINLNHPNENETIRCSLGCHAWLTIIIVVWSHKNTIQMWSEIEEAGQQGHRWCTTFKYHITRSAFCRRWPIMAESSCIISTRQS